MTSQGTTSGRQSADLTTEIMVVYASLTGNTKRLMDKLAKARPDWHIVRIEPGVTVDRPFHLVTFTTGIGQVPAMVENFLDQHYKQLQSVTVSGNMNWGKTFGRAGDIISERYQVPLLLKYELAGNDQVLQQIINKIEEFYGS